MASKKKQKKLYGRSHVVGWDKVIEDILECEKFGWSWFEELTGVHHTGIVFYVDFEARYTVNWTPKNGTKIGSIALETEGQLVFEDERGKDRDLFDYKECLQDFDMLPIIHAEDDHSLNEFFGILEKLCSFKFKKYENSNPNGDAENYDITSCNCRDHVESVLMDILPDGPYLCHIMNQIQSIRKRPGERLLYNTAKLGGRFVSAFGGILSCWSHLERFVEKWQAKAEGPFEGFLSHLTPA